jgi:hypothetical protein
MATGLVTPNQWNFVVDCVGCEAIPFLIHCCSGLALHLDHRVFAAHGTIARNLSNSSPARSAGMPGVRDKRTAVKYASARCSLATVPLKRLTMDEKAVLVRGSKQDRDIDAGHGAIVLLEPIRDCQPAVATQ